MARGRGQSPKRRDPGWIDFKSYPPGFWSIDSLDLPAHGRLVRRGGDDLHRPIFDHAGEIFSGLFFSKASGRRQIVHLRRRGIVTASQARYSTRALERSKLPEDAPPSVATFFRALRLSEFFADDETLGLGVCAAVGGRSVPLDALVIREALVA